MAINKESPPIGIDLGTSFCCVGVFRNGKVEIIANEQGNFTTPSVIAFNEEERLIGDAAKQQIVSNAKNTIFDVKRLIGRNFDDPIVQEDMTQWPFNVISVDGCPKIEIEFRNDIKFFCAVEISAMILGKMKTMAESYLNAKVSNAVITCPAYFNDHQRKATLDAGKIAGLNVLAIINEPTAAGIAYYGVIGPKTNKKILVYDLGGGTFDVSIINICGNTVTVEATDGHTHLGGEDFDNLLLKTILTEIKLKHYKDLSNDKRALNRLRIACERAKRTLSSANFTSLEVDCLFENVDLKTKLSRAHFDSLCSDLFNTTISIIRRLLQAAELSCEDIDEIVLVGGSTRIPKIQQILQDLFKGKDLIKTLNPDEVVAYGAAIQAFKIQGDCCTELNNLQLREVTPLSLGISTKCAATSKEYEREEEMWTLIKRNTPIPVTQSQVFPIIDHQTIVSITVLQGENPLARDNVQIGNFTFNGIPKNPTGIETITVTFSIDHNGILTVTAFSNSNDKAKGEITIHDVGRISNSEIRRMLIDEEMYRQLSYELEAMLDDEE